MIQPSIYFTPGPSQLYPTVPRHIQSAFDNNLLSLSHRSSQFSDIYKHTEESLRKLLDIPNRHRIFFLASATEAMERIVQNSARKHTYHVVIGAFSERISKISNQLGKQITTIEAEHGTNVDFQDIIIPTQTELITVVHNETSTGVITDLNHVYQLKKENPKALLSLDVVSSIPHAHIDFKYIDFTFFSVQKGFGLPAGLGVVIVSPKAFDVSRTLQTNTYSTGSYHSWKELAKYAQKYQTSETPNVLAIYLLGQVAQDMYRLGIENIREQTMIKAQYLYNHISQTEGLTPFVSDTNLQSPTVITVRNAEPDKLQTKLSQHGYEIGSGYGSFQTSQVRIANFPAHTIYDVKQLCHTLTKISTE